MKCFYCNFEISCIILSFLGKNFFLVQVWFLNYVRHLLRVYGNSYTVCGYYHLCGHSQILSTTVIILKTIQNVLIQNDIICNGYWLLSM